MIENILKNLQCGNISLRPFVVMADETEWPLAYTVSVNEAAQNCTISATDGIVRDYLFLEYDGDEITCRRSFENQSTQVVAIMELGLELKGITFGKKPRDDYFYHNENPRIYEAMTLDFDYAYKAAELTFSAAPKSIVCDGKELPFSAENGVTKLAIPGKKTLTVTF